jgi:hypothetical protein
MVDSRSHSFEDTSSSSNHHMPLTFSSRSESSQKAESLRITEFATINLQLTDSPASSQNSLILRPTTKAVNIVPSLQENRDAASPTPGSPERGRRGPPSQATFRSPISPDRFIPKREFGQHSSTSYRVNKYHYQLSPRERITRRRLPGEHPFLPAAHQSHTFTGQRRTPTRPLQSPHRPHLVADWAALTDAAPNEFQRRISAGAVWRVGGTAAVIGLPPAAISNDTRSVSGRGAGSQAFVARFLPKISRHDDLNNYESRLALALDIDPTTRVLGTCMAHQEKPPSPASPDYERYSPFVWKDSAWKKVERGHCKSCDSLDFFLAAHFCFCTMCSTAGAHGRAFHDLFTTQSDHIHDI